MLTREQLDHLCTLTALQLSDAEKEALLPQISAILGVIGQLDACELNNEPIEYEDAVSYTPVHLPQEQHGRDLLLQNIRHHIVEHMPQLQTGLIQ